MHVSTMNSFSQISRLISKVNPNYRARDVWPSDGLFSNSLHQFPILQTSSGGNIMNLDESQTSKPYT